MLKPLKDSVLFVFTEEVSGGLFVEESESGIYLGKSVDSSSNEARWAVVAAVGPEVLTIKTQNKILIGALRWTEGFTISGTKLWKTTESEILAVDTPNGIQLTPSKNDIFFLLDKKKGKVTTADSGLMYVESDDAGEVMCWGTVVAVGSDVDETDVVVGTRVLVRKDAISKFLKTEDGVLYKIISEDVLAVDERE